MKVNNKKIYDDVTFAKAVRLVEEGKLSLTEIVKELHTSFSTLTRNMDWYFRINKRDSGETDWRKIHRTKRSIDKKKKNVRIVFECQACSNESVMDVRPCVKCGSYCITKRELRNKVSSAELRSEKMTGQRFSNKRSKTK